MRCTARSRPSRSTIAISPLRDSETRRPRVSVIGLDDVVVVVDGGEVLVTTRTGAQLVGKLTGAANQ